jgi:hypothetical protein
VPLERLPEKLGAEPVEDLLPLTVGGCVLLPRLVVPPLVLLEPEVEPPEDLLPEYEGDPPLERLPELDEPELEPPLEREPEKPPDEPPDEPRSGAMNTANAYSCVSAPTHL